MLQTALGAIQPHVSLIALLVSFTALLISATAATIAWLNFRRKSSLNLRGSTSLTDSMDCEDPYISSVLIENLKDRAVSIFSIHLRVGYNFYLEIESFDESPQVLRPYESLLREYGPIELYLVNTKRVAMRPLLMDSTVKKSLVIATSEGKFVIKNPPRIWGPWVEYFYNRRTATVRPLRGSYEGEHVGGNVPFVLKLTAAGGKTETIHIKRSDYRIRIFDKFQLTLESLKSADSLRTYLQAQMDAGKLSCASFQVLDIAAWRAEEHEKRLIKGEIVAQRMKWFEYVVVGRLSTIWGDRKQKLRNRQNALRRRPQPIQD